MLRTVSAHDYFEQQYALRKSLASFGADVAEWEALSADEHFAGHAPQIERFGDHPRQHLELFKARPGEQGRGLVVFLHGGFWRAMERRQFRFMATPFLKRGLDCAIAEYRLMPGFRLADLVDDAVAGVSALAANAERLKLTAPTLIAGHSAGAHLALYATIAGRQAGKAWGETPLLLLSGVFDIFDFAPTSLGGETAITPEEVARWSIISGASLGASQKAVFVVGGEETDGFHRQTLFGAQQLCRRGEDEVLIVDGANHLTLLTRFARDSELGDAILARLGL